MGKEDEAGRVRGMNRSKIFNKSKENTYTCRHTKQHRLEAISKREKNRRKKTMSECVRVTERENKD